MKETCIARESKIRQHCANLKLFDGVATPTVICGNQEMFSKYKYFRILLKTEMLTCNIMTQIGNF